VGSKKLHLDFFYRPQPALCLILIASFLAKDSCGVEIADVNEDGDINAGSNYFADYKNSPAGYIVGNGKATAPDLKDVVEDINDQGSSEKIKSRAAQEKEENDTSKSAQITDNS
jgi:hypothetical protein